MTAAAHEHRQLEGLSGFFMPWLLSLPNGKLNPRVVVTILAVNPAMQHGEPHHGGQVKCFCIMMQDRMKDDKWLSLPMVPYTLEDNTCQGRF